MGLPCQRSAHLQGFAYRFVHEGGVKRARCPARAIGVARIQAENKSIARVSPRAEGLIAIAWFLHYHASEQGGIRFSVRDLGGNDFRARENVGVRAREA
jgi:hypothetical protein